MTKTTHGIVFFENHLRLLSLGKIDEMVKQDYCKDALLIGFLNHVDGKMGKKNIQVRGREPIKQFFQDYLKLVGGLEVIDYELLEEFDGVRGSIYFQYTANSNLGTIEVGDAWTMKAGKISAHYILGRLKPKAISRKNDETLDVKASQ